MKSGTTSVTVITMNPNPAEFLVIAVSENHTGDDGEPLYWCVSNGWVSKEDATVYNRLEVAAYQLPIGGQWVPLK